MKIIRSSGLALLPLLFATVVGGCATKSMLDVPPSQRLHAEVRAVLGREWPSAEYQRARLRLQQMGPEVDSILVDIIHDSRMRTDARAEALVLLADRGSDLALPTLRSALQNESETLRSASVLGLNQLARTSDQAMELIRLAAEDRSRTVRLNALQSLDIRDVATIRRVLARESDPEVQKVGLQLVSLAESRGAPLLADTRGALRTSRDETQPQVVFRPVSVDTAVQVMWGDLRIEVPGGRDIPIASSAQVVANVVPAFFSPEWSAVVAESDGEILVFDIQARTYRSLGEGIAPRLIPFTQSFVFLRERDGGRQVTADGVAIEYDVYEGSFISGETRLVGQLRALARDDRHGGQSPVRWMVVNEEGDGFVLSGEQVETFSLPTPVWTPAAQVTPPVGIPLPD